MIVLALDTALSATSVAVLDGDRLLAVRTEPMERGHQERLGGLVRDTMSDAALGFGSLDRIGVTVGPGSFTGLRVGLAFAKGLGLALNRPCVGVGTLEALAASVDSRGLVAAAIDARRGQVYLQLFREGRPLCAAQALTVEAAERRLIATHDDTLILVGSGGAGLDVPAVRDERRFPDPRALGALTAQAADPIPRPAPLYLRAPDAKTIAERAAG